MTDESRTGRELAPVERETRVTTGRTGSEVDRFYAGDRAHTIGLTEERAATIVRQSGNARNIAFLALLFLILFVPIYWFYDLGFPAVAGSSRLENEKKAQQVTDVARGYKLYLANCAQCHDPKNQPGSGLGGIGPPLNDQAKLYNVLTPAGLPGKGHLNPNYLKAVLEQGGRYVCGDPKSIMPIWADTNGGPLNYREIEELIAFITASKDTSFEFQPDRPEPGHTLPPPVQVQGWRDPNYQPPAGQPSPPPCWRDPDGVQIGVNASAGGGGSAAPIESPGTADSPRVIKLQETTNLTIADEAGGKVDSIAVKAGETIRFEVTNSAGFDHNFYIGDPAALKANQTGDLEGIPNFTSGTEEFTWTAEQAGELQFACTVPGHYDPMHGSFQEAP